MFPDKEDRGKAAFIGRTLKIFINRVGITRSHDESKRSNPGWLTGLLRRLKREQMYIKSKDLIESKVL
jgi:hypothetical protein